MNVLRQLSRFYPIKNEALKLARVGPNQYRCARCRGKYRRENVQVDHIKPVVSLAGFNGDWTEVINRLFCPVEGLQILCIPCHHKKTELENYKRDHSGTKHE